MSDCCSDARGVRRPIRARLPGRERPVAVRSRENVVLDRSRRPGPLTVDALPTLVKEQAGVTGARVKLGQVIRDQLKVDVVPRPRPNPVSGMRHLVAERRVTLDAEIGAPRAPAVTHCRRESLTRGIRSGKTAQIAGDAPLARHEEARRGTRRSSGTVLARDNYEHRNQKWIASRHV